MANSIVMKMRIFNHQNTNPMAVLVKGQPFLIDKLTPPKQTDQQLATSPQLATSTEGPPAGTPTTEGDLQVKLPPQKGTCRQDLPSHPPLKDHRRDLQQAIPLHHQPKTTCDHYSTGENNNKQERKHS